MEGWLTRTALLVGDEGVHRLQESCVAVLGLGGVGSACCEALTRAGIGHLILCDNDTVSESNLNRQVVALRSNIGEYKTDALSRRLLDINPDLKLTLKREFYLPEHSDFLYELQPDFIIDAIDTVTAKLHLAEECQKRHIPLITCLGTGNRLHPQMLTAGDITDTRGISCPLARVLRRELKKRGVEHQRVVFSTEIPQKCIVPEDPAESKGRHSPGSISFVPPVAGYILASEAVNTLLGS